MGLYNMELDGSVQNQSILTFTTNSSMEPAISSVEHLIEPLWTPNQLVQGGFTKNNVVMITSISLANDFVWLLPA